MGLGGVVLAGVGIVMVVLVANDRWNATWNAMLGTAGAPRAGASNPPRYVDNPNDNGAGGSYVG